MAIFILFLIPSIWSAFNLVRENNYERNVRDFIENNRVVGPHSYVYDYTVKGHKVSISIAGEPLSDSLKTVFLEKAEQARIKQKTITLTEHSFGMSQQQMNEMIDEIYTRTDRELARSAADLDQMRLQLQELTYQLDSLKARLAPQADTLSIAE